MHFNTEMGILVVQAMQLPILALITLFTINSDVDIRGQRKNGSILSRLNKEKTLKYIAGGMFVNLLNVAFLIGTNEHAKFLSLSAGIRHNTQLVLDLLSTLFLFIGSFRWLFAEHTAIFSKIGAKYIRYILGFLVCLTTGWLLFSEWGLNINEEVSILHLVFDCIGLYLAGWYFANRLSTYRGVSIKSKTWGVWGFYGWAFSQLLPLLTRYGVDVGSVMISGFIISTFSKCGILYSIYSYSRASLDIQNHELQENTKRLVELNKKIDEIAALSDNSEVISTLLSHLIDPSAFQFDYAIFSQVDPLADKIIHASEHAKSKNNVDIRNVALWVSPDGAVLGNPYILTEIKNSRKTVRLVGNADTFTSNVSSTSWLYIDPATFAAFEIHDVERYLIPLTNSEMITTVPTVAEGDVVGVLEIGYNRKLPTYRSVAFDEEVERLRLYLNNIYQTYKGNLKAERNRTVNEVVNELEKDASHTTYLTRLLEKCATDLKVEKGEISFLSLDNQPIFLNTSIVFGDLKVRLLRSIRRNATKPGIFAHVAQTKKAYFTDDVYKDPYYISGIPNVASQLSLPLLCENTVMGVMSLFSSREAHFNDVKVAHVQGLINGAMDKYLRIKLSDAVSNLVIPYSVYNEADIYESTCERISKYYTCNYIAVWGNTNESYNFRRLYATEKLAGIDSIVSADLGKEYSHELVDMKDPKLILLEEGQNDRSLNIIEEDAFINGFKAVVYLSLGKHKRTTRFIVLYSKKVIENIFPEDKTFLGHISNKLLFSLNFFEVFHFFDQLTKETYKREELDIVDNLTDYIHRISGCNVLSLFIYDDLQKQFIKSVTVKGELLDERVRERLDHTKIARNDFSYSIIENNTQWLETEADYLEYRKNSAPWDAVNVFEKEFWYREAIKSAAAIRIEFDTEIIGVLFLNYREAQLFNISVGDKEKAKRAKENRALITLLANMLGRVIKISRTFEEERNYIRRKTNESILAIQGEVAAGMMHNINNLFLELSHATADLKQSIIKSAAKSDKEVMERWTELNESVFGFQSDFLLYRNYLKAAPLTMEEHDSVKLFEDIGRIARYQIKSKKARLHLEKIVSTKITCDKVLLTHLVLNLIKNSLEANAKLVTIRVIELDSTQQYRVIEIQDNGVGVKKDEKHNLFKPYYTSKPEGTGLGLMSCKMIAEKHKGKIDYKLLEKGIQFSLYLPKNKAHETITS